MNKGEKDGVRVELTVVYKDNLVGKIIKVSDYSSKVILITNPRFSVTSQVLSNKALGIVKGQGGGEMILDNVVLSQIIKKDEFVVTRGDVNEQEIGILPNLIIGKIVSVNKNPSDLFQTAKVKSLLDFTNLSKVFIITGL